MFSNYSGYKLRTHMAKSLQTRSKTIRRAIDTYNKAAAALSPPRPSLDWSDVSHYGLIEQYTMLKATNTDVQDKHWSRPIYREMLKARCRIARAQEEIVRCNVEVRRLHTSIYDDTSHFKKTMKRLKDENSPMYGVVQAFARQRNSVHKALLTRIHQVYSLVGFTGTPYRGVSITQADDTPGNDESEEVLGGSGIGEALELPDDEEEDEGVESDDEVRREADNLENFASNVRD